MLITPEPFADRRGFFMELYNRRDFAAAGVACAFVQDNESVSGRGVLRGLHYQIAPMEQAKLVRVAGGEIFDVVVDLRTGSPTFGQWLGETLSAENRKMLFVPAGFAHGYAALTTLARVQYKVSQFYSPAHERGLLWNDPAIGVRWPELGGFTISDRDRAHPGFAASFQGPGARRS